MARIKQKQEVVYIFDILSEEDFAFYQQRPDEFIIDFIFHEDAVENGGELYLSESQKEILNAIADPSEQRVSAATAKGFGKTSLLSMAIIWFLSVFRNPKVVVTAPSFPQLKSALWTEVSKWLSRSLLKDMFVHTAERMYLNHPTLGKNWWAEPRTASNPDNMQGLHEDNLLLLIDEASGVGDEIFERLDTTMSGDKTKGINKLIAIGNGTQTSGFFFDSHHKDKDRWKTFQYDAFSSPFIDKEATQALIDKYGCEHDTVRVSVRGLFPKGSPDAFIPLDKVLAAVNRDIYVRPDDPIEIGLDVARFGDDLTVWYARRGYKVLPSRKLSTSAVNEVVDETLKFVEDLREMFHYDGTIRIKVDDVGIGAGATDYLKLDRTHNIEVIPCNFGGAGDDVYQNEASRMWGTVRDLISVISLPDERNLTEELSSRRFSVPNGKIMIEPKSKYKKDFKKSPDFADALVLAFAQKENNTKLIKNFDRYNSNIVRSSVEYVSGFNKIISIFYAKDMTVSIIVSIWDGYRLFIVNELVIDNDVMSIVGFLSQYREPGNIFIGNERMFDNSSSDIASQFARMGIRIRKSVGYSENGGINMFMSLLNEERLIVLLDCENFLKQMEEWNIHESKNVLESKYGLCYSLTYITHKLKGQIVTEWKPVRPVEYNKPSEIKQNTLRKLINPIEFW